MPVELLLLLLAWAATVSLIVILPWAVIRLAVRVLEADTSKLGVERGHAQSRHPPDAEAVTAPSGGFDDTVEPAESMPATATPDEDADG